MLIVEKVPNAVPGHFSDPTSFRTDFLGSGKGYREERASSGDWAGEKWWTPKDVVFWGWNHGACVRWNPARKKMHEYVLGYFIEIFSLVFKRLLNSTLPVNWHFLESCVPYEFQQSCANKI